MTTKFDITKFDMGWGSERWVKYDGRFVGRFKYHRPAANARHFVKFLVANFTVEEFFALVEEGNMAPAKALETKGYISLNILSAMKKGGYSTVREMLDAQIAAFDARQAAKARGEDPDVIKMTNVTTLPRPEYADRSDRFIKTILMSPPV